MKTKTNLCKLGHPTIAAGLVALALTALLYGETIALPLFSDDLLQIPWLESVLWHELWTGPSPYGYYRPLWYTLWRLWGQLVGGLHPSGLHILNICAHATASWLTGLLAMTWIRPEPPQDEHVSCLPACAAAALFAVFPFSRQAVAWPGAVYNPLVSAMAAGALLAYDRGRYGHSPLWLGLALLLAVLAPLTYEVGLLVGILIVLTEGIGRLSRRWPRQNDPLGWWALAFVGSVVITLALWRTMRGAGVTGFGLTSSNIRRNVSYLVQGLIFPTAPAAQQIADRGRLNPELCLWLVALPTLALLSWRGLRQNGEALWLGITWFGLFALPPMVTMEAEWFALAPRYLYMTATGGALIWTAAMANWSPRPGCPWHPLIVIAVLAIMLIPAMVFVQGGIRLYAMAGESIWDAAEAATADHLPLLLVNLPMRITPHRRTYPLGFEGVTPLPMRVPAEGLVYVHTGIREAADAISFGIVASDAPENYSYRLYGQQVGWEELANAVRHSGSVYLTRYTSDRIYLVEAGEASQTSPDIPLARFKDRVMLLDVDATCDESGKLELTTHWQIELKVETDATVFAHLLDTDGELIAQADGHPLQQMLPFWLWKPGQALRDVRHFAPVPPGDYTIRLGVWDLSTGERWSAAGRPDGVVLQPVHCP